MPLPPLKPLALALALALALPAAPASASPVAAPAPTPTTDLWPDIEPVTTVVAGSTLTVSAFDSTAAFPTTHSATAPALRPTPADTWPQDARGKTVGCDEVYTVKPGDTCNSIIGITYLYWNIDPQHLLMWNPNIGLECQNLKVGLQLCLFNNQQALQTESVALGY